MALTIYNNIASLTSQRYLGQTNSATSKTLERLSSGLRINHASDDASGLAISEKLRGQISGLKRASMNAQDGISMLQTGEGALQEVQNIIQRMRELAVQAANGTYTSNDRKEIQKEVDQLKSEINRISASTEFNTKKLLNGDATALWSSDSNKIDVSVLGKVAEGNYNININATPGTNYVYKTDVMTLKDGALAAELDSSTTAQVEKIDNISGLLPTLNNSDLSAYNIGISKTDVAADAVKVISSYRADTATGTNNGITKITTAGGTTVNGTGYIEFEVLTNLVLSEVTTDVANAARARFIDATTGQVSDWVSMDYVDGASAFTTVTGAFNGGTLTIGAANTNGDFVAGDKALLSQIDAGTVDASTAGNAALTITDAYGKFGLEIEVANFVSSAENARTTLYIAQMDTATGSLNTGKLDIVMQKATDVSTGTQIVFDVAGAGDRATTSTQLKDVARFVTADGRNLFDSTQELTIFGNGKQTTIYLEGSDTIEDFETKLTNAIKNDLGMGAGSSIDEHLVDYVTSPTAGNQAVEGTFVIQSALLGEDSKLSFIGDQSLIDGLSLATIQEGEDSELTLTVTNAHTGEEVGSDVVNDYTLKNVIAGVNVKVDSSLDVSRSWNTSTKSIDFSSTTGTVDVKLHLVDNSTDLQIGANEGQAINVNIAQIDTKSLGLDDVLMVDQPSAQKAITKLDKALEFVSSTRATIGAQINRLESAISNLNTARENLSASESRIRDLDMAEEMAKFTRNQILSQAGTAMLAQANQLPQMALQLLQ
jgi:flagellin